MIKKIIRGLIKIPVTPLVLAFYGLVILTTYGIQSAEWLYEAHEYDRRLTREIQMGYMTDIKRWFTTI